MSQEDFNRLLEFFKVMGNENRLKIVGLLATNDLTVGQIAERLNLKEPTVSEHLLMLRHFGFVTFKQQGNFRVYSFNPEPLHLVSKEVLSKERLARMVAGGSASEALTDSEKALHRYLDGDRLTQIPTQRKNLLIVLRWLAHKFEVGRSYTEKEVNEAIKQHHPDYATLRRELIDFHFMDRERGIYWRTPETEPVIAP